MFTLPTETLTKFITSVGLLILVPSVFCLSYLSIRNQYDQIKLLTDQNTLTFEMGAEIERLKLDHLANEKAPARAARVILPANQRATFEGTDSTNYESLRNIDGLFSDKAIDLIKRRGELKIRKDESNFYLYKVLNLENPLIFAVIFGIILTILGFCGWYKQEADARRILLTQSLNGDRDAQPATHKRRARRLHP
ncbi:MAG: hypothetical protein MSG64_12260 [Pyrinomonadaceae bacterium MAG19_C2-C3]|nr:hypothetical protein [Pyrinomonadaceae bacterium MAG19_C2-C3]